MFLGFSSELKKEKEPLQSEKSWVGIIAKSFRPCPLPSGRFLRKYPQTLHLSWILLFILLSLSLFSKILFCLTISNRCPLNYSHACKSPNLFLTIRIFVLAVQITSRHTSWLVSSAMVQWFALQNQQSPFYVVNKVTLTGENPSLKLCQPPKLLAQWKRVQIFKF